MQLDALKKGLALTFVLDQRFAEISAQSDCPLTGVIHDFQTFDDVSDFIVGIVIGPFINRFLQKSQRDLDQQREKECQEI